MVMNQYYPMAAQGLPDIWRIPSSHVSPNKVQGDIVAHGWSCANDSPTDGFARLELLDGAVVIAVGLETVIPGNSPGTGLFQILLDTTPMTVATHSMTLVMNETDGIGNILGLIAGGSHPYTLTITAPVAILKAVGEPTIV